MSFQSLLQLLPNQAAWGGMLASILHMDVVDRAQEGDLEQASAIMAIFAYHAAMQPEMFPRKPMPGTK